MIQDFPFTGIGMGAFGDLADAAYPFFQFLPGSLSHAHNLFLQIAVDLGIPGLVAWLATLILVCAAAWRVYRVGSIKRDRWTAGLGAGLLCSQVALIIHGLTDAITWGMVRPAPLTWVVWGLAVASWNVGISR
jgi:putative inorganic carbon (HCO3(-)) transporter